MGGYTDHPKLLIFVLDFFARMYRALMYLLVVYTFGTLLEQIDYLPERVRSKYIE